jgi:hypothetical protein
MGFGGLCQALGHPPWGIKKIAKVLKSVGKREDAP